MTCHLFLDNFSWNFMTFRLFWKVESFETDFCFKKTLIAWIWYHEIFVFSESRLSQKTFYCRKLIVFSCLQFADCYIWSRILFCGVILCAFKSLITESFPWKVFLKKNHGVVENMVFVFEIVSLKGLNKFWSNYLFFLWLFG